LHEGKSAVKEGGAAACRVKVIGPELFQRESKALFRDPSLKKLSSSE